MNGLLEVRSRQGEACKAAQRWRMGHVPAGSTDAVAYSINGTRSAVTAALHIALGDRWALLSGKLVQESVLLHMCCSARPWWASECGCLPGKPSISVTQSCKEALLCVDLHRSSATHTAIRQEGLVAYGTWEVLDSDLIGKGGACFVQDCIGHHEGGHSRWTAQVCRVAGWVWLHGGPHEGQREAEVDGPSALHHSWSSDPVQRAGLPCKDSLQACRLPQVRLGLLH